MGEPKQNEISRRGFLAAGAALAASAAWSSLAPEMLAADLPKPGPADWPRYGYDLHNTRFNPLEKTIGKDNVGRLQVKWKFDINVPIETTPTVIGDTLFFGVPGAYYALDSQTGKQKWKYEMPPKARAGTRRGVQYYKGRVYTADQAGWVRCLDAGTGNQVWERDFSAPEGNRPHIISCAPLAFDDKIYLGTVGNKNRVLCLHADTGVTSWEFYITGEHAPGGGGSVWTSPAVDEKERIVYVGTGSNKLPGSDPALFTESVLAFDADTGYLRWFYQAHPNDVQDLDFGCHPMIFDAQAPPMKKGSVRQCVCTGAKDGFYCLDRYTGELLWRAQLTNAHFNGGPLTDSTGYAYNRVYGVSNASTQLIGKQPISVTAALDGYTGRIVWWTYNLGGIIAAGIALANGVFYQGFHNGHMEALDADTGRVLWQYELPTARRGGFAIANGALYCGSSMPGGLQPGGGIAPTPRAEVEKARKAGVFSMHCFTVDGK